MKPWQWVALAAFTVAGLWFVLGRNSAASAPGTAAPASAVSSGPPASVVSPSQAPTPPALTSPWLARLVGLAPSTTPVIRTAPAPLGHQSAAGWYS